MNLERNSEQNNEIVTQPGELNILTESGFAID